MNYQTKLASTAVATLLLMLFLSGVGASERCRDFFEWNLEHAESMAKAEGIPYSAQDFSDVNQGISVAVCPGNTPDARSLDFYSAQIDGVHWLKSRILDSKISGSTDPAPYEEWMKAVLEHCPAEDSCTIETSGPNLESGAFNWNVSIRTRAEPHPTRDFAYTYQEISFFSLQGESLDVKTYLHSEYYIWRFPESE